MNLINLTNLINLMNYTNYTTIQLYNYTNYTNFTNFQMKSGEAGIRTLDGVAPITVFETAAFNHSATSPCIELFKIKQKINLLQFD